MSQRPPSRHTLRITGGNLSRRRILAPEDQAIRPTADKVRQAIFNTLNARGLVEGAVVLDAFCGTGAMGLEALSHGADHAILFDLSPAAVRLCARNAASLGLDRQVTIRHADATRPGPRPEALHPATLVFLDPPYDKGLSPKAFTALLQNGWIASRATLVLETARTEVSPWNDTTLWPRKVKMEFQSEKCYGDTRVLVWTMEETE
jgi:16S rRNA (guanine966-N2)-methyltransferase